MKKPPVGGLLWSLFLFYRIGGNSRPRKAGIREWGAGSLREFRSVPPTLIRAGSREIKGGSPAYNSLDATRDQAPQVFKSKSTEPPARAMSLTNFSVHWLPRQLTCPYDKRCRGLECLTAPFL